MLISFGANIKDVGFMNLLQSKNLFSNTFLNFVDTQSGIVNKFCQVPNYKSGSFTRRHEVFQKPHICSFAIQFGGLIIQLLTPIPLKRKSAQKDLTEYSSLHEF